MMGRSLPGRRGFVVTAVLCAAGLSQPGGAAAANSIVVGRSLPLTGPLKSYGDAKRDGGDAYIKKVNDAGGVSGRPIELLTLDDVYAPANTVANLRKLASESRPVAFLGLFGVPTVAAALPVLLELKIPAVGLTSGAAALRKPLNPYAFPVRASYADEAAKLVMHVKTVGISRIVVVYTDNPFGQSVKDTLVAALRAEGMSATAVKLDPSGKDADAAVSQALTLQPQAVFLTMLSQAAVPTLEAFNKAGKGGAALYAFSPVDATVIISQLRGGARGLAITQVVPVPTGLRVKVAAEYQEALKTLGRGTPSFYGLEAYIEAKVLVEGLRRAGTAISSASLVRSLETMNDFDTGGYFVSYRPDAHQGGRFVEIGAIDLNGGLQR
jgi:ABC-type branched-subunit amino acid transport system substrate-binding protein